MMPSTKGNVSQQVNSVSSDLSEAERRLSNRIAVLEEEVRRLNERVDRVMQVRSGGGAFYRDESNPGNVRMR